MAPEPRLRPGLRELWIVHAHPDDEVLYFLGTLAWLRPARLHLVCATGDFGAETARRHDERRRAAAALGAASIDLGLRDEWPGGCDEAQLERALGALAAPPDAALVTHGPFGEYGHPHHAAVFRACARLFPSQTFFLAGPLRAGWRVPADAGAKSRLMAQVYPSQAAVRDWGTPVERVSRLASQPWRALAVGEGRPAEDARRAFFARAERLLRAPPRALPAEAASAARTLGLERVRAWLRERVADWRARAALGRGSPLL
jgi:LmbE family N-acetylglucosaminyl deacetylase